MTASGSFFARLATTLCSTASRPMYTHSHALRPATRAPVSSDFTTRLARTRARIAATVPPSRPAPAGTGSPAPPG